MIIHKLEGGIYGLLVADALVSKCKGKEEPPTSSNLAQFLTRFYADSGAMTLCTMDSILDSETIDLDDIASKIENWYIGSYLASSESNISSSVTISQALRMYQNGMPAEKCGSKKEKDNCALLRMLPIALWNANEDIATIINSAHLVTMFSNQMVETQVVSAIFCLLIRQLLLDRDERISELLTNFYSSTNMKEHEKLLVTILEKNKESSGSIDACETLWSGWNAFTEFQDNFEKAITKALSFGPDWHAAILTACFSGIFLGVNSIPERWISQLDLSDQVDKIIRNFINKTKRRFSE